MEKESMVAPEEMALAYDRDVGSGTPEDAPWEAPPVAWLKRQPVVAYMLVVLIPTLTAFVAELTERTTEPLVAILLGGLSAAIIAGGAIVRASVTPTAKPRDGEGEALLPAPMLEPDAATRHATQVGYSSIPPR